MLGIFGRELASDVFLYDHLGHIEPDTRAPLFGTKIRLIDAREHLIGDAAGIVFDCYGVL